MKNKSLLLTIGIFFIAIGLEAQEAGNFTDVRDNKTYKTVKIGTQIWMAENIAYKAIAGCWAYDNDQENVPTYGYLYNWESVNQVCPNGWHLPSDAEWNQLTTYLGGEDVAKAKLKETGTAHWSNTNNGNRDANNESGFNALPGGSRTTLGAFIGIGGNGYWWSSTKVNSSYIVSLRLRASCLADSGC